MNHLINLFSFLIAVLLISPIKTIQSGITDEAMGPKWLEGFYQEPKEDKVSSKILDTLLFQETFENGRPFLDHSRQFAETHSFQVVADPVAEQNKVGRFELRENDRMVKRSIRSEVGFRGVGKEKWYAYSIFFPTEGYEKDNYPEIITQWYQAQGGSPPSSVQVKNDRIYLRSINRSDTKDNSNKVYTHYDLGEVKRGTWIEFVFHFIHSTNGDGLIEIWRNKKKIQSIQGPNLRSGFALPNFKVGVYKWVWNHGIKTKTNVRVLYIDNIRIGNERASFIDLTSEDH